MFWPQGWAGHFDGVAALIGISALLALFRYKTGVIPVIAACGMAGLLVSLLKPWFTLQGIF